ncbi:GDSL esterase/lipase At1g58480-like [Ananas comosus]|uniref:GDSL esterase/lipase At1g58480-like n=1 Tax=Ananas comosus TaxID=4615 RepID=A0A6P5GFR0_ANACO|nr:GDSL esterase/lipase At1g58480-like [Ananas comosus]
MVCAAPALSISILLLQLLIVAEAGVPTHGAGPVVPAVIILGDSIMDPGNNNQIPTTVRSNFPPYGVDFPTHKATGRFSNGKIASDFLASELGVKETLPAYLGTKLSAQDLLTGVSFASAGTGFDPATATLASVIPMRKQLEMFAEYEERLRTLVGEEKAASIIAESQFVVCAGSNDVVQFLANPLNNRTSKGIANYSKFLMQSNSRIVQDLVGLGARAVGVVGLPPVGCMPAQRTLVGGIHRKCAHQSNELAQKYNRELRKEANRLTAKLQGTKIIYLDIYSVLLDLIEHPKAQGFEESKKGCCGTGVLEAGVLCNSLSPPCSNPSQYVFWDSYHPTERANKVMVDKVVKDYLHFLQ